MNGSTSVCQVAVERQEFAPVFLLTPSTLINSPEPIAVVDEDGLAVTTDRGRMKRNTAERADLLAGGPGEATFLRQGSRNVCIYGNRIAASGSRIERLK